MIFHHHYCLLVLVVETRDNQIKRPTKALRKGTSTQHNNHLVVHPTTSQSQPISPITAAVACLLSFTCKSFSFISLLSFYTRLVCFGTVGCYSYSEDIKRSLIDQQPHSTHFHPHSHSHTTMADEENVEMPAEEVTEEVVEEPEIPLDPQTALFRVIQTSLHHEGLARGLHEAVKGRNKPQRHPTSSDAQCTRRSMLLTSVPSVSFFLLLLYLALDRREAHLCVLAGNCEEAAYTKLITALCKEHEIPLIKVEDRKTIGEWAGLCIRDAEGKARKVRGASCVVIKSWGEETPARQYILDHIKSS